jgi:putative transposase
MWLAGDNVFIERLWRSLKYEEVYLHVYTTVAEAKTGIGAWLDFYNPASQHPSIYAGEENRSAEVEVVLRGV